jgi:hypothetical protein
VSANTKSKPDLAVMRITIDDVRRAGYCVSGARRWFEGYGLDFRAFIQGGIAAEPFLATGDAAAQRIVAVKLENADE